MVERSCGASYRCTLHFLAILVLFLAITPSQQSSARRNSDSSSKVQSARDGIEKKGTTSKLSTLQSNAVKQIERGGSRLQRLYQLTQQQAQERLQRKTLSSNRQYWHQQQHAQQEEMQKTILTSNLQRQQSAINIDSFDSSFLTPVDR